jgi:hypothetical protein
VPTGFRLAQYDLALRRLLRLSELAIGDSYGAAIPAPRRSALRTSQGPSICRAATYLAMLLWGYKGPETKVKAIGVDLTEDVFGVHGVDAHGKVVTVTHIPCRSSRGKKSTPCANSRLRYQVRC